jgi:ATP-dependent DNA helicase RecG
MPPVTSTSSDPLRDSAQFVKGVGPSRFELLQRLGIETVGDLLFFFPRGYEDLSDCRRIADLQEGKLQTVIGEVVEMEGRTTSGGRGLLGIVISDKSGQVLEGTWFNQAFMAKKFRYGQRVAFSGKPAWYRDHWQINKPQVTFLDAGTDVEQPGVQAIYPLTEGLFPDAMRRIQRHVVATYADLVPERLPGDLLKKHRLPVMPQSLRDMHMPEKLEAATRARRRLVYEEFLVLQVALALRRRDVRTKDKAPKLAITQKIDEHIRRLFPFQLTGDQNKAIAALCKDMARERPMQRLLQADVGAGKTAVAVYALLLTVAHKHQAAIMAPTEVLARQHWRTISQYLAKSRVRRQLLTGGLTEKERRIALAEIRMGNVDLVVGTQALIQKDVEFAKLGLVVIDEQHRFGVEQRQQFRKLGTAPHYLVMTATPIPRTVALTVFGDLDVSVIREMPPGREPVRTRWIEEEKRPKLEEHLRKEIAKGRQLYVVCPLVGEEARQSLTAVLSQAEPGNEGVSSSPYEGGTGGVAASKKQETSDIKAAEQTYDLLRKGPFKDFAVGLLHGRMDEKDKDQVMTRFRAGEVQVLVSTSVIEVGVDVPNATLMIIEHADRFGLSQLHQLRGRISRGPVAGECHIFAEVQSEDSQRRLKMFVRTVDGFALAEEDVRIRGIGEFFGTRQHGLSELRVANLVSDVEILQMAREDAFAIVTADPGLKNPDHAGLRTAVLEKYGQTLDLAEIG